MLSENIFLALAIGAQCYISVSEQHDVTVQVSSPSPPRFLKWWNPATWAWRPSAATGIHCTGREADLRLGFHYAWREWEEQGLGGRLRMSSSGSSGTDSKAPIVHIWDIVRWKESKLNFVLHRTLSWRSGTPLTANQVAVPLVHDSKLYLTGDGDWTWSAPGSGLIRTALIDLQDPPLRIGVAPGLCLFTAPSFMVPLCPYRLPVLYSGPGWPWARPRLGPHLDAIPPLKLMPKYPSRYSSALGKWGGF